MFPAAILIYEFNWKNTHLYVRRQRRQKKGILALNLCQCQEGKERILNIVFYQAQQTKTQSKLDRSVQAWQQCKQMHLPDRRRHKLLTGRLINAWC